jgi:hypothetical protein
MMEKSKKPYWLALAVNAKSGSWPNMVKRRERLNQLPNPSQLLLPATRRTSPLGGSLFLKVYVRETSILEVQVAGGHAN